MAAHGMRQMPNGQVQVQVDLKNATDKLCECGGKYFQPVMALKIVSALQSPTGKELPVQIPAYMCVRCGAVLGEEENKT